MPQYCVVAGCRLRRGIREGKGISFFQFPNDTTLKLRKLAQKWLEFCGKDQDVENFKYHRNKTVCEMHFTPECFIEVGTKSHSFGQGTRRKRLHTGAVPTVTSVNTTPRRGGRRKTPGRKRVETEVRCIIGHVAWGHWCANCPLSPPRGHTRQWQRHHYVKTTSRRRFGVIITLLLRRVPAGHCQVTATHLKMGYTLMKTTDTYSPDQLLRLIWLLATGLVVPVIATRVMCPVLHQGR